jgi:hypothetical protein
MNTDKIIEELITALKSIKNFTTDEESYETAKETLKKIEELEDLWQI